MHTLVVVQIIVSRPNTKAFMNDKKLKEAPVDNTKNKVLEGVLAQIDKQYGKGSVMRLGQSVSVHSDAISTGSILIDHALVSMGFLEEE